MDFAAIRKNMIDGQLLPRMVTDARVLAAMAELPREQFVPKGMRGVAYVDEALPIARDRYMMEPNLLARLLQAAEVTAEDMALWVGCGSGYDVAVLARLANTVVALESDSDLVTQAGATFAALAIDNAVVVEGGLNKGYAKQAPYDVIVFGGAVPAVPQGIQDQLAEGGRLVAMLAGPHGVGRAILMTRRGETVSSRDLFDAGTPSLPGFAPPRSFVL